MLKFKQFRCYVEEFNDGNKISARLRDIDSDKQIQILSKDSHDEFEYIDFLDDLLAKKTLWPGLFSRTDPSDAVKLEGNVVKTTNDSILIDFDDSLAYSVEL